LLPLLQQCCCSLSCGRHQNILKYKLFPTQEKLNVINMVDATYSFPNHKNRLRTLNFCQLKIWYKVLCLLMNSWAGKRWKQQNTGW
jgi:hypothetical protein